MKKHLSILLLIAVLFSLFGCGSRSQRNRFNSTEPIVWDEILLKDYLPEPDKIDGKMNSNYSHCASFSLVDEDGSIFKSYVEKCKQFGYTLEPEADDNEYNAFNAEGYKLRVYHLSEETKVNLDVPIEVSEISIPKIGPVTKLPAINSNIGKIQNDSESSFSAYFGNIPLEKYKAYVIECQNKGFNVDYKNYDKSYYANNSEGYSLTLSYEGFNIMYINIKVPDETEDDSETSSPEEPLEEDEDEGNDNTEAQSGITNDFKTAMDSYEKFFDEYIAIMKKYKNNPNDMSIITDYTKYLGEYANMMLEFENVQYQDLSTEEAAYYVEVQGRITRKLLEVAN